MPFLQVALEGMAVLGDAVGPSQMQAMLERSGLDATQQHLVSNAHSASRGFASLSWDLASGAGHICCMCSVCSLQFMCLINSLLFMCLVNSLLFMC